MDQLFQKIQLHTAARIIDEQLKMFINFEEPVEEPSAVQQNQPTLMSIY